MVQNLKAALLCKLWTLFKSCFANMRQFYNNNFECKTTNGLIIRQ